MAANELDQNRRDATRRLAAAARAQEVRVLAQDALVQQDRVAKPRLDAEEEVLGLEPAALAAAGAALVAWLPRETMRPLVVVLMIAVALYTFMRKDFGQQVTRVLTGADRWKGAAFGGLIGLYDGFFGPGTGSFLIFGFIRLFGMDFVQGSASAKVINFATNLSAIAFFASHGPLLWQVGLVMAACNLAGSYVGTRLALKHGAGFIRKAFLGVVVVLIAKQLADLAG